MTQVTKIVNVPVLKNAGANPKFIYDANVMLFGSDPVAVDAVAHDIVVKERMERGVQQVDAAGRSAFLEIAAGLGLGVAERGKIELRVA